jgi:hypothetical protein
MARDEIAAINGKPASDYTLHELREILKQDDGIEAVDLVIRNSQGEKRLTIRKEYLFEASKKSRSTKTQQVGN